MRRAWLLTTLTGFALFSACGGDGNTDLFTPHGGASGAGGSGGNAGTGGTTAGSGSLGTGGNSTGGTSAGGTGTGGTGAAAAAGGTVGDASSTGGSGPTDASSDGVAGHRGRRGSYRQRGDRRYGRRGYRRRNDGRSRRHRRCHPVRQRAGAAARPMPDGVQWWVLGRRLPHQLRRHRLYGCRENVSARVRLRGELPRRQRLHARNHPMSGAISLPSRLCRQ